MLFPLPFAAARKVGFLMSVAMALVDFIPVVMFIIGSVILQRDLYFEMSKGAYALFSAGTIVVGVAGIFKATWKLLYALNICDFVALNDAFFPMQTTGFVLAAAGLLAMMVYRKGRGPEAELEEDAGHGPEALLAAATVPAVYESSMPFVICMVIGVAVMDGILCHIAKERGKRLGIVLFAISFVFIMGMGYLSSQDFTEDLWNWIAEIVNICGQGLYLAGALVIRAEHE